MLPIIAKEKLAEYVDIFCEIGYFNTHDTEKLLQAANKFGSDQKLMLINSTLLRSKSICRKWSNLCGSFRRNF